MSELKQQLDMLQQHTVDNKVYVRSDQATDLTVAFLFGADGPQTEEDIAHLESTLLSLGYGAEEHLGPPQVQFSERGMYRALLPALDDEMLERVVHHLGKYRQDKPLVWITRTSAVVMFSKLRNGTPDEKLRASASGEHPFYAMVETFLRERGWELSEQGHSYERIIPCDVAAVENAINNILGYTAEGAPLSLKEVHRQALAGAYGYLPHDLVGQPPSEVAEVIASVLEHNGYQTEPRGKFYWAKPLELPEDAYDIFMQLAIRTYRINNNVEVLVLSELKASLEIALDIPLIGDYQLMQMLQTGTLGAALALRGFGVEVDEVWHGRFDDADGPDETGYVKVLYSTKADYLDKDDYRLSLVPGNSVRAPVLVLDDANSTIIAMQILAEPQSVNATWAALMGGGKTHYIRNTHIRLKGAKKHVRLQTMLPQTNWKEMWLIHNQASLNEMETGEGFFYLLHPEPDEGERALVPPNFIPMLDKLIPYPVQRQWAEFLFARGQQAGLIRPIRRGQAIGMPCYLVIGGDGWEEIISEGVSKKNLTF